MAADLHSTLDEIRRITRELRPEALDDLGLMNALIALCSRTSRQGGLPIERNLTADLPRLSPELELVIYRVAQGSLTNVLRHSAASKCQVSLQRIDGTVELVVQDDGRGLPATLDHQSIGVEGMRERALLARGTLELASKATGGTAVSLRAPIDER